MTQIHLRQEYSCALSHVLVFVFVCIYIRRLRILCGCVFSACYTVTENIQTTANHIPRNMGVLSKEDCLISCFAMGNCIRADFVRHNGTCVISSSDAGRAVTYSVDFYAIDRSCRCEYSHSCTCTTSLQYTY